ncbi:MAG: hypothetical protein GX558_05205, partial [Clostridiales bacterium]|nr:hypothetical protein [Clostridiales bacterium]
AAPVFDRALHSPALAERARETARRIREDTRKYLACDGPFGPQFAAATDLKRFALFIDGEDSEGALAPYFGFCSPDDPLWRNYLRHGLSPMNPIYEPETGGLVWLDDPNIGHSCTAAATSPSLSARLAGCTTREEALDELSRIRSLSDWDANLYWWISPGQRRDRVCGSMWAHSCIAGLMLTEYLGLVPDAPGRKLTFAPWCPWPRFEWRNLSLGAFEIDVAFERDERAARLSLANRGEWPIAVRFGFYAPENARWSLLADGRQQAQATECELIRGERRIWVEAEVAAGETSAWTLRLAGAGKGGN